MTVIDAVGRISEIQTALVSLANPTRTDSLASSAFATTLSKLAGSTATQSVSAPSAEPATDSPSGDDVVATAKKYLGVPYVFGGEDSTGMDCSGLVQRVYADLGIDLPRVVPDQAKKGTAVGSLAEAQPGDLIVAKGSGHILIYAGDNKVIHAPRPGTTVTLVDNWRKDSDIETIRRIVPAASTASAALPSGVSASDIDALILASQRSALSGGAW
ncbi:C40 family peptidase [Mycetocola zhadangensis]|uniref:C40 family peptidase n=1 Tax=Mycetocola zhadangensis TaxID=1164595 RepID=UPI003A4D7772